MKITSSHKSDSLLASVDVAVGQRVLAAALSLGAVD